MEDREMMIARGIAQGAAHQPVFTDMAKKGLVDFLRQQIVEAEWQIARYKASIEAYEVAIKTITDRYASSPN